MQCKKSEDRGTISSRLSDHRSYWPVCVSGAAVSELTLFPKGAEGQWSGARPSVTLRASNSTLYSGLLGHKPPASHRSPSREPTMRPVLDHLLMPLLRTPRSEDMLVLSDRSSPSVFHLAASRRKRMTSDRFVSITLTRSHRDVAKAT